MRQRYQHLALFLTVLACADVAAQGFLTRDVSVNGRQVQEIRLGTTTRTPASSVPGAGLVAMVVTNGPVAGTTTLAGAFLDGGNLFVGGALPAFTSIVAQGSVFSLGSGCTNGTFTDFPYINANRPQIARFDANTGQFSTFTPTIPGTDNFDSADCAVGSNGTTHVFTNRTQRRIEVYKDNGGGLTPVQNTAQNSVITPFGGGVRPSIVIGRINDDEVADILYMTSNGATNVQAVNTNNGTLGPLCQIFISTPPVVFIKPRETALFLPNLPTDPQRVAVGDFNLDGTTDIVTVNRTGGGCATQVTSGPVGSANGGNGYNWNGYGISQAEQDARSNVLWGSLFYVTNGSTVAQLSPVPSPYAGRGGPFDACAGRNLDKGSTFIGVGTAASNTQISYSLAPGIVAIGGTDNIFETSFEATRFLGRHNCLVPFSF